MAHKYYITLINTIICWNWWKKLNFYKDKNFIIKKYFYFKRHDKILYKVNICYNLIYKDLKIFIIFDAYSNINKKYEKYSSTD